MKKRKKKGTHHRNCFHQIIVRLRLGVEEREKPYVFSLTHVEEVPIGVEDAESAASKKVESPKTSLVTEDSRAEELSEWPSQ